MRHEPPAAFEAPHAAEPPEGLPEPFTRWFAARGWAPRAHQLELLAHAQAGDSTLLIAPTGAGKTLAGFLPSLIDLTLREARRRAERLDAMRRDKERRSNRPDTKTHLALLGGGMIENHQTANAA